MLAVSATADEFPKKRVPIAGPEAARDAGDARDIAAVLDRVSAAMQGRDVRTLGQVFLPDATIVSTRRAADGAATVKRTTLTEWLAQIGAIAEPIEERIGRPDITIADDAASASAPYSFYLGGKLHHCGIDFFQLVRTGAGWQIASIAYNATTVGCAG